ncbi:MAG: DMT family transporter [Syntrophotalea acetylenica]|jgi:drug/metabolite transporter (DMT)-like permease|uniref:EamA domain-containing protein n=1 Tax=Syntrophotalea acetylenica TaxID=29542 RepID=A0A1L3GGN7_SYNAC|nr:DMT family transporter [Syntrophotalea acetylenica]APG25025.1 hypothetical protein A7E75_08355 [Syntrophotalea acetylenica]APG43095.1 hypothetical protein A6070_02325 [Syntrophotalea acetylenica]MDD4456599.1 DMT family transporter [Syntrophotalea acetylenica]
MTPWFFKALLALVLIGLQRFFYKVAAERGCNTALTSLVFMATVAVVSWSQFLCGADRGDPRLSMVLWGLVNGVAFLASAALTIEALRRIPAVVGYSITRLSTVFATLFSVFFFQDRLWPRQWCGILLAIAVLLLFARRSAAGSPAEEVAGRYRCGVALALLAMVAGTVATVSSKFAALHADKWGFMAIAYSFSAAAAGLWRYRQWQNVSSAALKAPVIIGIIMGGLNLIGFYLFLWALETGPLAVIAPLVGLHFTIAVLLSAVLYRERLDFRGGLGILLAVAAVLLMKA